ncbi:hypothetical protein [Ruminococcus albus]|uniref:hypothetical protein n=1 Tax=Ruminococcus albus TaxID=1264 RepID=UPI001D1569E0|nr:hypothetical protein [Ruminococcus albus]MCC3349834.1 hypothetical protein [Ruminococcus albus 8]
MKNYSYVAKDTTGKTIKGTYEAENEQELLDKIYEQGLFCVSYNEALGGGKKKLPISSRRLNWHTAADSCRQ